MAIAVFTFGSFGDIATILQLAFQLRLALNDASGASAEVRALMADFDRFTLAIQQAKVVLDQPHSGMQPATRTAICDASKIRSYEARMTRQLGRAAWREYWATVAWEILGGRKEVDAMRLRLSEQVALIQTLLSASNFRNQEAIQTTMVEQHASLKQIQHAIEEIPRHFGPDMPSFMFDDPNTHEYYQPFARMTLQAETLGLEFWGLRQKLQCPLDRPIRVTQRLYYSHPRPCGAWNPTPGRGHTPYDEAVDEAAYVEGIASMYATVAELATWSVERNNPFDRGATWKTTLLRRVLSNLPEINLAKDSRNHDLTQKITFEDATLREIDRSLYFILHNDVLRDQMLERQRTGKPLHEYPHIRGCYAAVYSLEDEAEMEA
ncbi:hypothetical protein AURDEDRAFT_127528 [Auricularia subglabra TFB-10046 SS5]|nr:hypothetical protein AURDEDRAFT_127528 [Auricularia subglabra TFB-10046 SS5]